ncbi:hypothetical protein GGTG_02597 [Gaeumannomyces tritici R3-111a-1]|uniref:Uncharacterized protein n=1 Tax=Gaeumannomyces tritici (strain R3-111a-1) TaxID=644352 RepID=J3NMT8_GAET3|nr:hypothetical protein GGTG_02597 [Gaeumannomyces tritici R3-111a-1]EJT77489.1 hypothetical protein GGTG_02597 [Gaeumannomyces tritici R3-111a-1]
MEQDTPRLPRDPHWLRVPGADRRERFLGAVERSKSKLGRRGIHALYPLYLSCCPSPRAGAGSQYAREPNGSLSWSWMPVGSLPATSRVLLPCTESDMLCLSRPKEEIMECHAENGGDGVTKELVAVEFPSDAKVKWLGSPSRATPLVSLVGPGTHQLCRACGLLRATVVVGISRRSWGLLFCLFPSGEGGERKEESEARPPPPRLNCALGGKTTSTKQACVSLLRVPKLYYIGTPGRARRLPRPASTRLRRRGHRGGRDRGNVGLGIGPLAGSPPSVSCSCWVWSSANVAHPINQPASQPSVRRRLSRGDVEAHSPDLPPSPQELYRPAVHAASNTVEQRCGDAGISYRGTRVAFVSRAYPRHRRLSVLGGANTFGGPVRRPFGEREGLLALNGPPAVARSGFSPWAPCRACLTAAGPALLRFPGTSTAPPPVAASGGAAPSVRSTWGVPIHSTSSPTTLKGDGRTVCSPFPFWHVPWPAVTPEARASPMGEKGRTRPRGRPLALRQVINGAAALIGLLGEDICTATGSIWPVWALLFAPVFAAWEEEIGAVYEAPPPQPHPLPSPHITSQCPPPSERCPAKSGNRLARLRPAPCICISATAAVELGLGKSRRESE